jgi:predicted dehydrogenase
VFHAPLIAATSGMEVAAIVTRDEQRRAAVAEAYPEAELLDSPEEVWGRFDLVVIASPNRTHVPLARAAIEHGMPVVVDKPMAPSATEAAGLAAFARAREVALCVFQNRRWDSDFLAVRRVIGDGSLGRVARLESRIERYRPEVEGERWREQPGGENAGGQLFDLGAHLIDQALVLFGSPMSVYAEADRRRPGAQVDDDTFVALRFEGGETAHLWMSTVVAAPASRFRVIGLEGTYVHPFVDNQEEALREGRRPGDGGEWGREERDAWGTLTTADGARELEPPPGAWPDFYARVRDCVLGEGPPPVSGEEGAVVIAVIEAARTSAAEGRVVDLA